MSDKPRYSWKRFWIPRGEQVQVSKDGFLYDPLDDFQKFFNPHAVQLQQIDETPCLILLGEPGIGKSTELDIFRDCRRHHPPANTTTLPVDLSSYSSPYDIDTRLFGSDSFREWRDSDHILEVLLDSFDECHFHLRTLPALLRDKLEDLPTDRLRLRIACRTSEWPQVLEAALSRIWGKVNFRAYELAPLRDNDARTAAEERGLDPDEFMRAIYRTDVARLATVPLTLDFLLSGFEKDGKLPGNQVELYHQGCLRLCTEWNPTRRDSGAKGDLSPEERLDIGERIAAACVFSKRSSIYVGPDGDRGEATDLTISELAHAEDNIGGQRVSVREEMVRDALATALFRGAGRDLLTWTHRSYAEFLAARFVATRRLAIKQVSDLVLHPGAPGQRWVVPQLRETAAWIAGMVPEGVPLIASSDPQVLLRSSVSIPEGRQRAEVVEALLRLLDDVEITEYGFDFRRRYDLLEHSGLADQLRPYIEEPARRPLARRIAMEIAEACRVTFLSQTLLKLALNRSEDRDIRDGAARTVARIGDPEHRMRLRPLLDLDREEDPEDQLRANTLRALWPNHISVSELFQHLTLPRDRSYMADYFVFLSEEVRPGLKPSDLSLALAWVGDLPRHSDNYHGLRDLTAQILEMALEHIALPGVLERLSGIAARRLLDHERILGRDRYDETREEKLLADPERRRQLVEGLLGVLEGEERRTDLSRVVGERLVRPEDIPWLLRKVEESPSSDAQELWARLAYDAFGPPEGLDYVDEIKQARRRSPVIDKMFGQAIDPVRIVSREADDLRAWHREHAPPPREESDPTPLVPPLEERAQDCLDRSERGEPVAWLDLVSLLHIEWRGTDYFVEYGFTPDVRQLPEWRVIGEDTVPRCLAAAERFLARVPPEPDDGVGNHCSLTARAGYRALRFLQTDRPERLDDLPEEVWTTWSRVILTYPNFNDEREEKHQQDLLAQAYARSPSAVMKALEPCMAEESEAHDHLFILDKVASCWDSNLVTALLEKAKTDPSLKPGALAVLVDHLLDHDAPATVDFGLSLLSATKESNERDERVVTVCAAMLKKAPDRPWAQVWPAMQSDPEFGMAVITKLAHHHEQKGAFVLVNNLPEREIADLYLWLTEHHAPRKRVDTEPVRTLRAGNTVEMFRDSLFRFLQGKGTRASVGAIGYVRDSLPREEWLKHAALRTEQIWLERTWEGISPAHLFDLASREKARFVDGPDQLLEVVIDSVKRSQEKLQGQTPEVEFLWNDDATPKKEKQLSDYIKLRLDEDLRARAVIANREVQIDRYQQTDIRIDALRERRRGDGFDRLTVIVETKGCWNRNLKKAMEGQLRDRYLRPNNLTHGLYIVGWFLCEHWSREDYRRRQTPKKTFDEARAIFSEQARALSEGRSRIRSYVLDLSYK